jgi:hypothetical protein
MLDTSWIRGTQNELRGYTARQYLDQLHGCQAVAAAPDSAEEIWLSGVRRTERSDPWRQPALWEPDLLPRGGGGVRFQLSKKYHVTSGPRASAEHRAGEAF